MDRNVLPTLALLRSWGVPEVSTLQVAPAAAALARAVVCKGRERAKAALTLMS
jgi:hypothetical protein